MCGRLTTVRINVSSDDDEEEEDDDDNDNPALEHSPELTSMFLPGGQDSD